MPSTAAIPTVRRLPVPVSEPPFDDEVAGRPVDTAPRGDLAHAVQGTLALAFVLPTGVPSAPQAPPDLRLVPPPRPDAEADLDEAEFGPQPTPRRALPEPRHWSGRFAQAVVEVLAGDRPVAQLVRWTTTDVYDEVASRVLDCGPARTEQPRAVVRSVHVTEPADGVAEVAAMVRRGLRTTAVALRLEGLDGRWQCTAIELG
ncbi:MAG TPA: Rv3235 family protein [Actinomycetes bacterium]|nr:Rv3235 family protein [Actinomycetes bacterium]